MQLNAAAHVWHVCEDLWLATPKMHTALITMILVDGLSSWLRAFVSHAHDLHPHVLAAGHVTNTGGHIA